MIFFDIFEWKKFKRTIIVFEMIETSEYVDDNRKYRPISIWSTRKSELLDKSMRLDVKHRKYTWYNPLSPFGANVVTCDKNTRCSYHQAEWSMRRYLNVWARRNEISIRYILCCHSVDLQFKLNLRKEKNVAWYEYVSKYRIVD